jgi:hypothetical protein
MLKFLLFILLITFLVEIQATELDDVRILDMSTNEKSITIDRGELDHFKAQDYAKFYIQIGDQFAGKDNPKIFLVAEGELIKSFPRKSFWYLKNIAMPNLIYQQSHLIMMSTRLVGQGRGRKKVSEKRIVFSEQEYSDVDKYLAQNKKGIPEKLIIKEDDFDSSSELVESDITPDNNQVINTYEKLTKKPSTDLSNEYGDGYEELFYVGKKQVVVVDVLKEEDKKFLETMSKQYLEINAKLKYGLTQGLYSRQIGNIENRNSSNKLSIPSVFEREREDRKAREVIDPHFAAKIKRDGFKWSDDMDDATLRRYFISTGIVQEKVRRERVLNEREGHEFMLHYSGSLSDHTTAADQNYRAPGYLIGVSYDLHLARSMPSLRDWSVQFSGEWGVCQYDLGGINGTSQEKVYGAMLNYYIINNPLTLNAFIVEAGMGIKAGVAQMNGTGMARKFSYQILSAPTIQLLSKYRFRAGDLNEDSVKIGSALIAGLVLENKKLSLQDLSAGTINGMISVNDIKFQIGMGFYF